MTDKINKATSEMFQIIEVGEDLANRLIENLAVIKKPSSNQAGAMFAIGLLSGAKKIANEAYGSMMTSCLLECIGRELEGKSTDTVIAPAKTVFEDFEEFASSMVEDVESDIERSRDEIEKICGTRTPTDEQLKEFFHKLNK